MAVNNPVEMEANSPRVVKSPRLAAIGVAISIDDKFSSY